MVITVLFGTVFSGIAEGQTLRRTYSNFRKLEVYAQRVDEIVRQFDDRRAADLMEKTQEQLEQARIFLFNTDPPEIIPAQAAMFKAKRFIDLAARKVLDKPFGNLKLQLDELISRAENAVMQVSNDEANYLLNQARRFRRRAYDSYNSGNPLKAQQYYRVSYFFARKCLDYTGNKGRDANDQLLDLEVSVQQMLEQGEALLQDANDPYLKAQLADARQYYAEAQLMAERGDTGQAVRRLRLIKRLLYRLYDQAERGSIKQNDRIGDDLYALKVYLESLNENIEVSKKPRAGKLLKRAELLYQQAEKAYRNGEYRKSEQKIALSQRIANQLFKINKKELAADPENLKLRLTETRRVLEMQQAAVQNSGSTTAGQLWEDAVRMLDQADRQLTAGDPLVAFQLIQAATRMSVRLQRELKDQKPASGTEDLLENYRQVMEMTERIKQNDTLNENMLSVLEQISDFAETGKKYLDRGDLILADEYLKTAMQQLKQFTARWRKK